MTQLEMTVDGSATQTAHVVAFGATVALSVSNTAGIDSLAWSVIGVSHASFTEPTIVVTGKTTATIDMPADALSGDYAIVVAVTANGGRDSAGRASSQMTSTRIIGTQTYSAIVPFCVNETFERDSTVGTALALNQLVDSIPRYLREPGTLDIDSATPFMVAMSGTADVVGKTHILVQTSVDGGVKLLNTGAIIGDIVSFRVRGGYEVIFTDNSNAILKVLPGTDAGSADFYFTGDDWVLWNVKPRNTRIGGTLTLDGNKTFSVTEAGTGDVYGKTHVLVTAAGDYSIELLNLGAELGDMVSFLVAFDVNDGTITIKNDALSTLQTLQTASGPRRADFYFDGSVWILWG